ncbi:uncharacterized protein LOC113059920 isoform X2 [Carassius auratus]|uniref:Uncharacterized protein LOC113059920 isoform X2 n=1 Tax=Carassius auratus TaxID=7957 RepID=A0A6P6LIH4_CARAU|nr:uncharacterized protein LOC113059920 isoform X2 [Carassius auratus]XP_026084400.1 uncharacterized protein LOC113059920 isoform X2 [Carassius auratus]
MLVLKRPREDIEPKCLKEPIRGNDSKSDFLFLENYCFLEPHPLLKLSTMACEEERTQENLTDSDGRIHIVPDEMKLETSQNICQDFILGRCGFGDRCRLSHSVLDVPQTTHSEEDDTAVTEKQSKTRKNGKKTHSEKQPLEPEKDDNLTTATGQHEESINTGDVSNDLEQVTEFSEEQDDFVTSGITKNKQELGDAVDRSFTENAEKGPSDDILLLKKQSAPEDKKMAASKKLSLNRLAKELSVAPKKEQTEIVEEWKDSWDGVSGSKAELVSFILPKPLLRHPPPNRPTHFICFRVDSPACLQAFQRIQRKVLSLLPQSEPLWMDPATLHVTLSLLVLKCPEEVSAAAELMRTTIRNSHKPAISVSFTPKLRHFNGTVLHVTPQPLFHVQSLNSPLQEAFKEKGWLHRHSRSPTYHLTLAKSRGPMTEKMFERIETVKLGKDINFGKQEVCVHLLTLT